MMMMMLLMKSYLEMRDDSKGISATTFSLAKGGFCAGRSCCNLVHPFYSVPTFFFFPPDPISPSSPSPMTCRSLITSLHGATGLDWTGGVEAKFERKKATTVAAIE